MPSAAQISIPVRSIQDECGYFKDKKSDTLITTFNWFREKYDVSESNEFLWFGELLMQGWRRSGNVMYITQCQHCNQCIPIRIPVNEFAPSKSQRVAWRKNQDIEIKIEKSPDKFVTEEKILMLREYDFHHNGERRTIDEIRRQLETISNGYSGIWNMEYYLNGKLIGVCILDYSKDKYGKINSLSSNYFYYDVSPEILKRSIGVFSVLKEIELCRQLEIPYYYLGLYLPDCRKMNYKIKYKPYELLLNNQWTLMPDDINAVINRRNIIKFPKPGELYNHPDVVCVTDDIPPQILYSAYMQGIFPWFNEDEGQPVIWQCPEKRFVLNPKEIHISKSIKKFLKHNPFTYTIDECFEEVIEQCSMMNRPGQPGTWIGPKIKKAYTMLHKAGIAHSIEAWHNGKLAGGFYGELIGIVFFGESMFTLEPDSSKSAFVLFTRLFEKLGGQLIDCQAYTDNMARYGATEIPRDDFLSQLKNLVNQPDLVLPKKF